MKFLVFNLYFLFVFFEAEAEYTAAVVEFFPEQETKLEPSERLKRNVDGYIKILDEISKTSELDIIVFPESTIATNAIITTHEDLLPYSVDVQINGSNICYEPIQTFITPLACAAMRYKTYIVVNLYEKATCERKRAQCHSDGWDFFNTNVVFNRQGIIISKYRKFNLFGEMWMSQTEKADISIFKTDFGVTFGMFICFDILFKQPALDLINKHNVTAVIYPTMWFSELPFLTALQTQLQWAYALNVTLLSSGANNLKLGSGGTSVYQGTTGSLVHSILGTNESKPLLSKIPSQNSPSEDWYNISGIDRKAKQMDGFYFKQDELTPYSSKVIPQGQTSVQETVCSKDNGIEFCCNFQISLEWNNATLNDGKNHYQYHMVAYTGVRSFSGVYNGGVEICGVIACIDKALPTCGKRFSDYTTVSWPAQFLTITVKAEFDIDENKFQYPNSLLSNIEPIHVNAIEWTSVTVGKKIQRTYSLKTPVNRLMTFAIYGRDFSRDSPVNTGGGNASSVHLSFSCLTFLIILNIYKLVY